jgi:hypothetical protein
MHVLQLLEDEVLTLLVSALLKQKAEKSFFVSEELHWGQLVEIAFVFTIFSNLFPHVLH